MQVHLPLCQSGRKTNEQFNGKKIPQDAGKIKVQREIKEINQTQMTVRTKKEKRTHQNAGNHDIKKKESQKLTTAQPEKKGKLQS